jgi:phenylacetate-CoA ligase
MPIEDTIYPLLRRYIGAPDWIKASAGRAYAMLPAQLRLGPAYEAFRKELATTRSHAAAMRLAHEKLAATLGWAIRTVPAYQKFRFLLRSLQYPEYVLSRLPLTAKAEIKADPDAYVSHEIAQSQRLRMHTGGSTFNPMRFCLQKHVSRPKEYAFIEDFRSRVNAGPDVVTLALRGRSVPGAARQPGRRLWMYEPIKRQLILSSDHLEEPYMPLYAEALASHLPEFIEAFPSALYPIARWLEAHPMPEFTSAVKGVMLYSENAYGFQMRLFRKVFPCPVLKHYGQSERVLMAASMPDDDRYFFWPQYGWFELVDFRGSPVSRPGVLGEIVGTGFDNQAMPFVRYRTGDLAVLSDRGHPALPGYMACERIEGRLQEFLVCRDQRLISITTMGAAHFGELASVEAIQYEQQQPGEVTLKVLTHRPLEPDAIHDIERAVREKTQGGCEVRVACVDHIERTVRGKRRMLIQHLDIGSYLGAAKIE